MRITIIAVGTRGDVQPALALAKGLQAAGFSVSIAAGVNSAAWIQSEGIGFAPINIDLQALMGSETGQTWTETSSNPLREIHTMRKLYIEYAAPAIPDLMAAVEQADVVLGGFVTLPVTAAIAEKMNKRHMAFLLQPITPTRAGWACMNPFVSGESALNLGAGWVQALFLWYLLRPITSHTREKLGLPAWGLRDYRRMVNTIPTLYGFSETMVPRPADWGADVHLPGYLFLDEWQEWQPPVGLTDFLNAGAPPVYVGFGSMSSRNPTATTELALAALRQSGQRGVLAAGWAGLGSAQVPDNVYVLESAPHQWLFPRMSGIVHHGGAGTTAAAARAGVPMTIIPHISDQPFWGRRSYELGIGTQPLPRASLNASALGAAIRQLATDERLKARATAIGTHIQSEDGVANAVRVLKEVLGA